MKVCKEAKVKHLIVCPSDRQAWACVNYQNKTCFCIVCRNANIKCKFMFSVIEPMAVKPKIIWAKCERHLSDWGKK